MAFTAGIDIGTRMTKTLIYNTDSKEIVAAVIDLTGHNLGAAAQRTFDAALAKAGLKAADIGYVATTGYGRYQVEFRNIQITEISCHSKGALKLFPKTQSVLDVGAQNSRAMRVAPNGRVTSFRMNEKCASGAGRFIERVAGALEIELDQFGPMSLKAANPQEISSVCAVLAESEVINHVTEGQEIEDILMGANNAVSDRIVALLRQVKVEPEVTLTGGVAKNAGMVKALENRLELSLNVSELSEYAGALGACVFASERLAKMGQRVAA
ncbi:MAG: 2-hydroxyglutaryl-CoA dehydratase [Candidatus Tectomicrobia bacterium]|nr:2-hydroxyglutaryl-CoA dehydratase [Candidatus Tectomicrobia bacterium]